jgi:hypothetical protein
MNERIKELAEQCYHRYSEHNIDLKKFAELIVQDCLAQVDKVDSMLEDDNEKTGVAWCGLAIARHFGVEL